MAPNIANANLAPYVQIQFQFQQANHQVVMSSQLSSSFPMHIIPLLPFSVANNEQPLSTYMTTQGMGMQQHEYSPQSMHFVPFALPPLTTEETVDEAALPGPLRLTRVEGVDWHMVVVIVGSIDMYGMNKAGLDCCCIRCEIG
jgi:hypothetical protein